MQLGYCNSLIGQNRPRGSGFTGPLDAFTTGLLAAFDAEYLLLSTHAGGAFRVRESIGNTEAVIGYTAGRIDATAFNAHIGAGNGYGVRWMNQVSGGTDHVQTSDATKQGQVLLNQIDSGAVLKLDNVNDGYTSFLNLSARPWTIYLVEKGVAGGTTRTLQSPVDNRIISTNRNASNTAFIGGNVSNHYAGFAAPHVAALVGTAGGTSYFVDGIDRTATSGNTTQFGQINLGIGQNVEGANSCVCTILVYNVAHDNTTRAAIEAVLRTLRPSIP